MAVWRNVTLSVPLSFWNGNGRGRSLQHLEQCRGKGRDPCNVGQFSISNDKLIIHRTHTGVKVDGALKDMNCNIVVVTISEAFEKEGWVMSNEERSMLENKGVKVLTGIHALGDDVNSAFSEKCGGKSFNEIVAQTLYRFCQGMKVCVELYLWLQMRDSSQ